MLIFLLVVVVLLLLGVAIVPIVDGEEILFRTVVLLLLNFGAEITKTGEAEPSGPTILVSALTSIGIEVCVVVNSSGKGGGASSMAFAVDVFALRVETTFDGVGSATTLSTGATEPSKLLVDVGGCTVNGSEELTEESSKIVSETLFFEPNPR